MRCVAICSPALPSALSPLTTTTICVGPVGTQGSNVAAGTVIVRRDALAAGLRTPRIERPAGLTQRETEVVGLLARGLQTKQVARALGISVKTADNHIQGAYAKMGVSTRAAAALFAMQHGLVP